jgi:hypothetical protein
MFMSPKHLTSALGAVLLMLCIVLVSQARAGQVDLTWDAPSTNTDGTPITDLSGYTLYYWQPNWDLPGSVEVGTQTSYTLADLADGETYSIAVTASNTSGNESVYSNTITATASSGPVPPPNHLPVANADSATTAEDTPVSVAVLANDSDVDGDALTVSGVTQGTAGSVSTDSTTVTYTPGLNLYGSDSFTYTISDGQGGTATASVTVIITSLNDAPVAVADSATTAEDTPVSVAVLANDSDVDGDALTVSGVTQAAAGRVSPNGTTVTYTPNADFHGLDRFTYTISDGQGGAATATVSLTVTPRNDDPVAMDDSAATSGTTPVSVAVLANDSDVDGDALTVSGVTQGAAGSVSTDGTTVTYTPNADFYDIDRFTYTISDGQGGSATATVSVRVFVQIVLEATTGEFTPPMQQDVDDETPESPYVWVPDDNADVLDPSLDGGEARYLVDIPKTDTYVIWGRVQPTLDGTGSFFLTMEPVGEAGTVHNLSPATYEVAPVQVGDTYYIDQNYTITALPAELDGLMAIKTAAADEKNRDPEFLSFTLWQNATLYVAYDTAASGAPDWLITSFVYTGQTVDTTQGALTVWQQEVQAGDITLPGNRYNKTGKPPSNYVVFIALHGAPPAYRVWEIDFRDAFTTWGWDPAAQTTDPVFFLESGAYTLVIKQRQSATKLHKLLLTNDLEAIPQD